MSTTRRRLNSPSRHPFRHATWCVLTGLSLWLGGCASSNPHAGFEQVQQLTQSQGQLAQDAPWQRSPEDQAQAQARVASLLAKPLSADDAVQIALLNNRGLQAAYFELGASEAELAQASRLPNPGITFSRLKRGDEIEFERGLHIDLARLLLMPLVARAEDHRAQQARHDAALKTLSLAQTVRQAWVMAVASEATVRYARQVLESADASEELASRMTRAGNWTRLDHTRQQAFYAEAALGVARASQAQVAAREQLIRLLGLWGDQTDALKLPERLPDLPASADDLPDIERQAMASRLDLQAMKARSENLAHSLGLSRITGVVNVLEIGGVRNSSNEAPRQTGYEIGLELPLFDWGTARVARAESVYMQSVNELAQAAVEARSQVRQAYLGYRSSHDIARHYRDEILPLQKRISEENVLRYNGMFISVFDLLADARAQSAAVQGYLDALRDFWLAQSDLQLARVGQVALRAGPSAAAAIPADAAAGH